MRTIWVVALLTGCAAQPRENPDLLDVAVKTPEQIRAEQQQDIERAQQSDDWVTYVCAQPVEEQKKLIEQTIREQGWRMACPRKRT